MYTKAKVCVTIRGLRRPRFVRIRGGVVLKKRVLLTGESLFFFLMIFVREMRLFFPKGFQKLIDISKVRVCVYFKGSDFVQIYKRYLCGYRDYR